MFYLCICLILLIHDPSFITTCITAKGNSQEKRVLGSSGEMSEDGKFRVDKFNDQNY